MATAIRQTLAWIGAVAMVASGAMHSLAGWPAMRRILASTSTSNSVIDGLAVPWHFAGAAMVIFGLLVGDNLRRRSRYRSTSRATIVTIGIGWVVFGVLGLIWIKFDPTFALFIIPGLMITAAPR